MEKEVKVVLSEVDKKAKELGAVHVIRIEDGERKLSLYLKEPDRNMLGLYYGSQAANPIRAAEVLLRASRIDELSDKDIFEKNEYFYAAYLQIDDYLGSVKVKKSLFQTL